MFGASSFGTTSLGGGSGGGALVVLNALAGQLGVALTPVGTLDVHVVLAGSIPVVLALTGTLTRTSQLGSWTAEESQKCGVRTRTYASLSKIVPPVAAPSYITNIRRVSIVMPSPTLDARGRPS